MQLQYQCNSLQQHVSLKWLKPDRWKMVPESRRLSFRWIKHNFFFFLQVQTVLENHMLSALGQPRLWWVLTWKLYDFSWLMSFVTKINKCALGFYSIKFWIDVDSERFLFIKIKGILREWNTEQTTGCSMRTLRGVDRSLSATPPTTLGDMLPPIAYFNDIAWNILEDVRGRNCSFNGFWTYLEIFQTVMQWQLLEWYSKRLRSWADWVLRFPTFCLLINQDWIWSTLTGGGALGGLSELVAAWRNVQKETNTLLTQEIERQGGSGAEEKEDQDDDDES